MSSSTPFPPSHQYLQSVRQSSQSLTTSSNITISNESITRLLLSPTFTSSFSRVSKHHGLALPLNFPSHLTELNLLSILSLLNFGSGFRKPLHEATGRGAWDTIRALVFGMYISSDDTLTAKGMKEVSESQIAELIGVSIHTESPHPTIPGVTVGTIGGPLYDLVKLITGVLNQTGKILIDGGYPDLGSFVLEALKEAKGDVEVILERDVQLVKAFPALQDMSTVNNQPIYCFKKALFLVHALTVRFTSTSFPGIIIPDTRNLPVFSDNVLPSLLIYLGVIDLQGNPELKELFKDSFDPSVLELETPLTEQTSVIDDGPHLSSAQSYILRAAAIHACERIVEVAKTLDVGEELKWINELTLPDLDMWLWSIAKDRKDYRKKMGRLSLARRYTSAAENDLRKVLTSRIKDAMKSKNQLASTTLRSVLSEINAADKAATSPVPTGAIISIIRKAHARRNDSAAQFTQASRPDLAEKELKEAEILSDFLPPLLGQDQIDSHIQEVISTLTPQEKAAGPKITGKIFKSFYGKVDKSTVDPELVKKRVGVLLAEAS
ncbi:hypothetical protein VNI00_012003 [Paramarasmius palmivorus]|uniref:Multifunctional fusion protein n=1 Tax=Paramarasmius palmivorus TaxID=297713 RepID=A0AAW0C893_9AGAR